MWGGRFSARPADIMQAINVSIGVDRRLWAQDLAGSRAHCRMLAAQKIITGADADATFAQFRGKVVVVNLWAMWCAPCRTEMPTLARLAEAYTGGDLVVLPINVDATEDGLADARSFIDVHEPLPLYSDLKFQLPFELPGEGKMPQTILLDRQGRIRAHFSGEADWASPEARALMDALLAEPA